MWNKIGRNIVVGLIATLIAVMCALYNDFLISFMILFVSYSLFFFSISTKYSKLMKSVSLLIFFHFIIFPWLYVILIKNYPKSFKIDSDINEVELVNANNDLHQKLNPIKLSVSDSILESITESFETCLDSTFKFINSDNILYIENYSLHKSLHWEKGPPPTRNASLVICDNDGGSILKIDAHNSGGNLPEDVSIRFFLTEKRKEYCDLITEYKSRLNKIKSNDVWYYSNVLPYTINVFDSPNFKPISKISNFLMFAHKAIVLIFLFGIVYSNIHTLFLYKNKSNS